MRIRLWLHDLLTGSIHRTLNRRTEKLAGAEHARVGRNLWTLQGYIARAKDLGAEPTPPPPVAPAAPKSGPTGYEAVSLAGSLASLVGVILLFLQAAGWLHLPHPGPAPVPPAPAPVDPLTATLQAAYAADPAPDKAAKLQALQSIWTLAPAAADDPAMATAADLLAKLHNAAQQLVGDSLPGVRKAIETELDTALPTNPAQALDPATRQACKAAFTRIATSLSGVQP